MTSVKFDECTIVTPHEVINPGSVVFDQEKILAVGSANELKDVQADLQLDCRGNIVTPGLIDLQVNGGGGHMFSMDVERSAYEEVLKAHASVGTTSLCPTIISGPIEQMVESISLAADFCEKTIDSAARVVGIHVEGPFLHEGKRGGHAADHLMRPSVDVAERLINAGRGNVRIVTLAPELPGSEEVVQYLRDRNVFVSIGHSKATADEALTAYRWGVMGATHLFNAMEGMSSRAPGCVGATLSLPGVYAGLIADMLHVAPTSVLSAFRAKGPHRMYLTTDAVSPLGSNATSFDLYGVRVTVRDGGCYTDEGVLAGTATPLSRMVRNLVGGLGLGLVDVVGMATRVPAEILRLTGVQGCLSVGAKSDLVVWEPDLTPATVWVGGREMPDGSEFM